MKHLRIIFTILCAACIAALMPLGFLWGWAAAGVCFLGALLFLGLMLLCKQSQEIHEDERSFSPIVTDDTNKQTKTDEQPENNEG